MKVVCIIFVAIFATVDSLTTGVALNSILSALYANKPHPHQDKVQEDDVKFFLLTRSNPYQAVELNQSNMNQVDPRLLVKMIVHGWLENSTSQWVQNVTREYLKKSDYNVIQVDYTKISNQIYSEAAFHVGAVGVLTGRLIANLSVNYGVPLSNVHIIAHSLGAQVAGSSAKEVIKLTGSKISRITALDAAEPLFGAPAIFTDVRLTNTDAHIVDAIHTDGGVFGYRNPLGTVDFFPNGGVAFQPGCPHINLTSVFLTSQQGFDALFCSHHRSCLYFISSINDGTFVSTKCSSWDKFQTGNCSKNFKTLMGEGYTYSPEATGNFYLRTTSTYPFAETVH